MSTTDPAPSMVLIGRMGDGGAAGREDAVGALGSIAGRVGHRVGIPPGPDSFGVMPREGQSPINEGQNSGAGLIVEGQVLPSSGDVRTTYR